MTYELIIITPHPPQLTVRDHTLCHHLLHIGTGETSQGLAKQGRASRETTFMLKKQGINLLVLAVKLKPMET